MALLTIGDQFPAYRLTALIGGDLSKVDAQQPEDYFTTISSGDFEGKWRVVFFWPKDFTFVFSTESPSSASWMKNSSTATPRCSAAGSTASSSISVARTARRPDGPAFPMLSDLDRELV